MLDSISARQFDEWVAYFEPRQFDEWVAYFELEPWGTEVLDVFVAHIVSAIISPHVKKGANPPSIKECRLFAEPSEQSEEEQLMAAQRIAASFAKRKT